MNTYYIYKATNLINGKVYIGCTNNIGGRIRQHITTSKKLDSYFHIAIEEFGIKNFSWQIIDYCYAKEDGAVLEANYIQEYDTIYPNGYNEAWGSGGAPKTKPFVCLTLDGKFVKRYDYLSMAHKDGYDIHSVSASLKSASRTANGKMFMYEDEYKKTGARTYKEPQSTCMKPIIQCDLEGKFVCEYRSVSEAGDKTGFRRSNISANLTLQSKTTNGFIFVYKNNFPIKDLSLYKKSTRGRKVVQLDKETGELLNIFDSVSDAGKFIGKSYKNIQKILGNPNRTAYGYRWMDYDNYISQ